MNPPIPFSASSDSTSGAGGARRGARQLGIAPTLTGAESGRHPTLDRMTERRVAGEAADKSPAGARQAEAEGPTAAQTAATERPVGGEPLGANDRLRSPRSEQTDSVRTDRVSTQEVTAVEGAVQQGAATLQGAETPGVESIVAMRPRTSGTRVRVLLVDDEPEIVEELGEFLGAQGFDWVGAHDAQSARRRFTEDPEIALLVTDLAMPGESGLALVESLERDFGDQRVFASIVVTAHHNEETMLGSLQKGVRDFIGKPVDPARLLESVRGLSEWVERRRAVAHSMGSLGDKLVAVEARISQLSDEVRAMRGSGEATVTTDLGEEIELPADWREKLTNRQQEVVRHVARGMSNYQIGYEMGISENTVKLYVSQVLKITRCRNRTQLALVARGGSA